MNAESAVPILNVSSFPESVRWFEKLGWRKQWGWGEPEGFGAMKSGNVEIFLCEDGQGGRGKGTNARTFGPGGSESADKGVWMSIFVADVDAVHRECLAAGIEVVFTPHDMEWGVREMHIRHPDGHVFRVSKGR
jgi:catechol 2,3-dioxygenase-like lactoylglutathione lyase family enzyme